MSAGTYDLKIEQGATLSLTFTYQNEAGTPINLTNMTARAKIREDFGSAVVLELTTANGRITLGGALGTIALNVPATTTATLSAPFEGVWDLELVNGATVTRLLQGKAVVSPEVTY